MASHEFRLTAPTGPTSDHQRELWLQHAAGLILVEDVLGYARSRLDPDLAPEVRTVAEAAIRDALYGLMMVADGVTGVLRGEDEQVSVSVVVRRQRHGEVPEVLEELDLFDGEGACMGFHGWMEGDFGGLPVDRVRSRSGPSSH